MIVSNLLCRCGYKTVTIVARRRMRLRAEMSEILGRGLRIAGFDNERSYLFTV